MSYVAKIEVVADVLEKGPTAAGCCESPRHPGCSPLSYEQVSLSMELGAGVCGVESYLVGQSECSLALQLAVWPLGRLQDA